MTYGGRLEHYSHEPIYHLRAETYRQRVGHKPCGFWVSVAGEDDWPSWCRDEDFRLKSLEYRHVVALSNSARLLHLSSAFELDAFHEQYGNALVPSYVCPDWVRVAAEYDGIIITPYLWQRRLDGAASRWYYGWDCASGCIWNLDVIESISVLEAEGAEP